MKQIRFIWGFATKCKKAFFYIFFDVMFYALFMLMGPLIISFMVDNIIANVPFEPGILRDLSNLVGGIGWLHKNMWFSCGLMVLVYVCTAFAIHKRSLHVGKVSEHIARSIRDELYNHLQTLPYSYHKMKDSGDLIQRSTSDIETIRRFIASQLSEMMFTIINVTFASMILFALHVPLAILSICLLPFILLASFLFFAKVKKIFLQCDEAESKMTTVLQENLSAMRVVKAFHQEQVEILKFEEHNEEYRKKYYELMHALSIFWSTTDFLGQVQILVMVGFGVLMALQGDLTLGTFIVFLMYESTIVWPMRQLGRILADMGKVSVAITRIKEVLDEPCEDLTSGKTPTITGQITFDHVSFHYTDDETPILQDISFTIPAHQRVAIMGHTGSGKSSLVHLLSGIYDYQEGNITLDGVELKDISKSWLRKHVQIVLQEPFLFSKTIYDNIALSNRMAEKSAIEDMARLASIHKDINAFSFGYETMVGEKGVTLSGGQKQRVAIARTLLTKSPILVFDDSLSALDSKTDSAIQDALQQVSDPMTMITITHRVNSAMRADLILVLDKGRLVQQGSHEQLIVQEGIYRRIFELQNAGGEST